MTLTPLDWNSIALEVTHDGIVFFLTFNCIEIRVHAPQHHTDLDAAVSRLAGASLSRNQTGGSGIERCAIAG